MAGRTSTRPCVTRSIRLGRRDRTERPHHWIGRLGMGEARIVDVLRTEILPLMHQTNFKSDLPTRVDRKIACPVCGLLAPKVWGRKTCSAKCGYVLRKSRHRKQRNCNHCGVLYWPGTQIGMKFCSRKCYYAEVGKRPAMIAADCTNCGASFRRTRAAIKRHTNHFCSAGCQRKFMRGENSPSFRGPKDPNRGPEWRRLAEAIRVRDGYSCRRCGRCRGGQLDQLSVDHVRPWRSFEDKTKANHPDNLVTLCKSCHAFKTHSVERAWLKGDVLAFNQWVRSLHIKSAAKGFSIERDKGGNWKVYRQDDLAL